ncbi:MAG: hypothetical protein KAJ33_03925, partial [Thermoplasmata archaeon]|nr:hypothetical protein [Thermoplasmata archaeon]
MKTNYKRKMGMILTIAISLSFVVPAIMAITPAEDSESQYYLLQFNELPSSQLRNAMESSGIEFQDYMNDGIYLVRSLGDISSHNLVKAYSNGFEPFTMDMKLSNQFSGLTGAVDARVILHDGVDVENTANMMENAGITVNKINTVSVNYIRCTMDISKLDMVTGWEDVKWIDIDGEPQTFMDQITSNLYTGVDAAQTGGFTGSGMLGQVQDNGCDFAHPDLQNVIY